MHKLSKYIIRHVKGKSRPFGSEIQFCPDIVKLDQGALGMSDPCGPYNWPFNPNQYSELTAFLEFLLLYSLLCCPLPSGRPKLYRDPGDQVVGLPYRVRMSLIYSLFVPEYATKY